VTFESVKNQLDEISLREQDALVAKFIYNLQVRVERADSKNNNNIRYLYYSRKKRVRARHYSKVKSKVEKCDKQWLPLPRYSSDARDCIKLCSDFVSNYKTPISVKIVDETTVDVVISGYKLSGRYFSTVTRLILIFMIMKESDISE
jgi:hypothetical protein